MKNPNKLECVDCGEPATELRCTQFAGDHPFCNDCAKLQPDYEKSTGNTYWIKNNE